MSQSQYSLRTLYLLRLAHAGVPAIDAARRVGTSRAWTSYVYQRAGIVARRLVSIRPCAYCGKPIPAKGGSYCNSTCQRFYRKEIQADGSRPCRSCGQVLKPEAFYAVRYTRCIACVRKGNRESKAGATRQQKAAEQAQVQAQLVQLLAQDQTGLRERLSAPSETPPAPDCLAGD